MKEKIKRKKKGREMGEYIGKRLKDNYEEDIDIGIFTVHVGNIRPT